MTTNGAIVRDFRRSDALAVSELRRDVQPFAISTPQLVAWEAENAPASERRRLLVATVRGRIAGVARTGLPHDSTVPDQSFTHPRVAPEHCGRGGGGALLTTAEDCPRGLGAHRVPAWVADDERSSAFAARHGYRPVSRARFLRLDLVRTPLPPLPEPLPDGVGLRTYADPAEDTRAMYEADAEAAADEPGHAPADAMTYEDWLAQTWEHPALDLDLTSVVTVDGRIAAYSLAETDGRGRYSSGMTGARRAFRGRGPARPAKLDSPRRAREAGRTEAFTTNDTTNAATLSINESFGYEPCADQWRGMKSL